MSQRRTVLLIGALSGAFFLHLAMHSLDWGTLSTELAHVHWPYAIPILLALLIHLAVKASRWRFLIRP